MLSLSLQLQAVEIQIIDDAISNIFILHQLIDSELALQRLVHFNILCTFFDWQLCHILDV